MINHYRTLGVPLDATSTDIQQAYRKLIASGAYGSKTQREKKQIKIAFDALTTQEYRENYLKLKNSLALLITKTSTLQSQLAECIPDKK
jgi:DnaJ-class molecular chaperone